MPGKLIWTDADGRIRAVASYDPEFDSHNPVMALGQYMPITFEMRSTDQLGNERWTDIDSNERNMMQLLTLLIRQVAKPTTLVELVALDRDEELDAPNPEEAPEFSEEARAAMLKSLDRVKAEAEKL